ncbi:carbohydrate binding family 9 domain-containing protein [bacterium SCSIO 12741]|nr:carbohydrate binding family 9 domain-containing protein [bacterium SCSIO 12741]
MKRVLLGILLLLLITVNRSMAQTRPAMSISKTDSVVKVDGLLDDFCWKNADTISQFIQHYPTDSAPSVNRTEVMMTYNDRFIYVAAICRNQSRKEYVLQSLKRDFDLMTNDHFAVYIDPFNDQVNGFVFALNPLGTQMEGALQNGSNIDNVWDHIWYSEVKDWGDYWTLEMAIPLKSIRYKTGLENWNINFSRTTFKDNEIATWAQVPFNFSTSTLSNTGALTWDRPIEKAKRNVSIIPYAIARAEQDMENGEATKLSANAGGDAKIVLTPSLNLDLTINPDFSQVEVDDQVTNLSRFELFFPEKRTFFIENSDLFAKFGFRQIRPFFSRRIGLHRGEVVPIIGGARISGKLSRKLRVGAMTMQTAPLETSDFKLDGQNYSVAAFQQQIFGRSNIGVIAVNRQAFANNRFSVNDYNRVLGVDYDIYSADNKWRGKVFYHKSFVPENYKYSDAHASWLMYNSHHWFVMWNHEYVAKNYEAQTGFVPRNRRFNPIQDTVVRQGYWRLEPKLTYRTYPKNSKIVNNQFSLYLDQYMDVNFETTDYDFQVSWEQNRTNTSGWVLRYSEKMTWLLYDRDITFSGNDPHPAGKYQYRDVKATYNSDIRRKLNGELAVKYGSYYTGQVFDATLGMRLRLQPFLNLSLDYRRTEIRMPQPYAHTFFDLIQSKVELTFTRTLYWTTYFQYNAQLTNFNVNSRVQWRFRPMSDFYVVYTDNYGTTDAPWSPRNRSLVFKLVYWLNI